MLAHLPAGTSQKDAIRIREAAGVEARLLSEMQMRPRGPDAFILGFAGHTLEDLAASARRLGEAARAALQSRPERRR